MDSTEASVFTILKKRSKHNHPQKPERSWVIPLHHHEGLKHGDPDFYQTLYNSSIICLKETKQEFYLPNYKSFNSNRTGSTRSGGVCIGRVHRIYHWSSKACQDKLFRLSTSTVFPNIEDEQSRFTIINIYDSPENSSFKTKLNAAVGTIPNDPNLLWTNFSETIRTVLYCLKKVAPLLYQKNRYVNLVPLYLNSLWQVIYRAYSRICVNFRNYELFRNFLSLEFKLNIL